MKLFSCFGGDTNSQDKHAQIQMLKPTKEESSTYVSLMITQHMAKISKNQPNFEQMRSPLDNPVLPKPERISILEGEGESENSLCEILREESYVDLDLLE